MNGSNRQFRNQSRRLKNWDYTSPSGYFVTICTHLRKPYFGNINNDKMHFSPIGQIVDQEWVKTGSLRESVELNEYVIMPNHVHGIIFLKSFVGTPRWGVQMSKNKGTDSLGLIIGQFKSACTRRIRAEFRSDFAWQARYYDHVIRDQIDLQRIREYIRDNPLKWALDEYYSAE